MRQWMWLVLLLPAIGSANIISPKPDAVSVTIYRASEQGNPDLADPDTDAEGIAMISEARELDLPEGESIVEFVGVAETIVPESARLDSLPGVIIEANFDYKLISPGELISNSIGQMVRLIRTDQKTGKVTEQRARLASGPDGVLLDIDGKIEALDCSGAPEKIVFDALPENLRAKPVLSVKVRVAKAGKHAVRLSYLATGFDWSANYVARIRPDGRTLDLTGWVTLANKQNTGFVDAPVQVIAGNIERDPDTAAVEIGHKEVKSECWPIGMFYNEYEEIVVTGKRLVSAPVNALLAMAGKEGEPSGDLEEMIVVKQRDLGDYKLYELPFKTDLASQQVKKVMMTYNLHVPFEKIYTFTTGRDEVDSDDGDLAVPARVLLRMQNKEERGLGKPLPAGNVVVMEPNGEQLLVAGINNIKDVAVGLPIDVEVGSSSDVIVIPKVVREYEKTSNKVDYEYTDLEVTLVNGSTEAVQFEYRQDQQDGRLEIVRESSRHIMQKGLPTWAVKIPPRSQSVIKYTVRHAE